MKAFSVGDCVAYSADFCRSIHDYTDCPHWRGTVKEVNAYPFGRTVCRVKWDHSDVWMSILDTNLAKPGPNMRFCAC